MSLLFKRKFLLAGLLSLSLAGPACVTGEEEDPNQDEEVPAQTSELSGTIAEDQTWSGDILVTGDVSIRNGAKITIEAGTTFYVQADVGIEFGWNSHEYSVFANGTEEEPIVFRGETQEPGFWRGISFRHGGIASSNLDFVEIHDAGGDQPALVQQAGFTVSDVTVSGSGDVGVEANKFRSGSANLTVTGSADDAVVLTDENALANFPYGGDLTGNTSDQIVLDFSTITTEVSVQDPGVPFLLADGLYGRGGGEFTVSEGVLFLVAVDQLVEFGWNSNEFLVDLQGSSEAPVIFEGVDATPGTWRGVRVNGNVLTTSTFNHVVVRHAGTNDTPAVDIRSGMRIQNLTIEEAFHTGFSLYAGLRTGSENINIYNTQGRAAVLGFQNIGSMPAGTYEGNEENFIDLTGSLDSDATIKPLGAPYRVIDNLTTRNQAKVVIEPGTEFYFGADRSIEFGWNANGGTLTAVGTEDAPIIFTSEIEEAGAWRGLIVGSTLTSNSTIEHAEFHYAAEALTLGRSINVENCTFADYELLAINAANDADIAALLANNTFDGSGNDDVLE